MIFYLLPRVFSSVVKDDVDWVNVASCAESALACVYFAFVINRRASFWATYNLCLVWRVGVLT